jgi:hypothetical protein
MTNPQLNAISLRAINNVAAMAATEKISDTMFAIVPTGLSRLSLKNDTFMQRTVGENGNCAKRSPARPILR